MMRTNRYIYIALAGLLLFVGCTKTEEQEEVRPDVPKRELQFTAHLVTESEWGAAYAVQGDSAQSDSTATTQGVSPLSRSVAEPLAFVSDTLTTADTITVISNSEPWFGELSANTADSTATDFSGYEPPLTRGTPIESVKGLTQLRINLYNTGTADFDAANPPAAVTQVINATGTNGVFSYSPAYNWTNSTDKLTMFTYAPQPSNANGITDNKTTLTYTVPTTVANQPDLCIAPAVMSQANTDGNQHLRSLAMKHMLTAVGFAIKGYKVTISKVEILGVANSATLDLQAGVWGAASGSVTFSPTINSTNKIENNHTQEYTDITTTTGWLMMVPQNLSASTTAKIKITFKEEGGSEQSKEVLISKTGAAANWEAGKKVVYNIRMRTAPVVESSELTILDYRAGFTTSTSIKSASYGIAADDRLTFTWGNESFKMHQGAAKFGNTAGGDRTGVTTGLGVADNNNWWFFTTDANTTTSDRSVYVTATGKKSVGKVFKVTQKPLNYTLAAPNTIAAASGSTQVGKYTINSGLAPNQTHAITWSNVPTWLDAASLPKTFAAAGGNITYKANSINNTGAERSATMTVKMGHLSRTVAVKQATIFIKTDVTSWTNVTEMGATKVVKVTTVGTNNWTASVSGAGLSVSPTSGTNGQTCTITYAPNIATANPGTRSGAVTFKTNPVGVEAKVTTSQLGAAAYLTATSTAPALISDKAQVLSVTVKSNVPWKVANSAFVTATPASGAASPNGTTVTLNVAANGAEGLSGNYATWRRRDAVVDFQTDYPAAGTLTASWKRVQELGGYNAQDGKWWAIGNLIWSPVANKVVVGDYDCVGLFFRFYSLIGWATSGSSGNGIGYEGRETYNPYIKAKPEGYTGTTGYPGPLNTSAATDIRAGKGDPCTYYLGEGWRTPSADEFNSLFNSSTWKHYEWGKYDRQYPVYRRRSNFTNLVFMSTGFYDNGGQTGRVYVEDAFYRTSTFDRNCLFFYRNGEVARTEFQDPNRVFPVRCVRDPF